MLFHSYEFIIFLPIVFILYWTVLINKTKYQNALLLISSYIFYGWWDWRFLILIFLSSLADYLIGIKIEESLIKHRRQIFLYTSIIINIGTLFIFKYANFFIDNLITSLVSIGIEATPLTLNIILPLGISFYTFQTLSYSIDIYHRKIKATHNFITFATFVSFFPQLVAGPIERAANLLPQFNNNRAFDYKNTVDGMRQILWGLFKKVVIADNCAVVVNLIFSNYADYNASSLLLGAIFFSFQIYGDFSGYSDIAIGIARLFGFKLMQNFSYPYFSKNIAEFWRRWHISLTTWFRDYVFIPLGGSRGSKLNKYKNILIIFALSGFWHGANWTFIVWGLLNASLYIITQIVIENVNPNYIGKLHPSIKEAFLMIFTFMIVTISWVFFRAENIHHAFSYIHKMFSFDLFHIPNMPNRFFALQVIALIIFFLIIEWHGRDSQYAIAKSFIKQKTFIRYAFYYIIVILLFWYGGGNQNEFIYFQF